MHDATSSKSDVFAVRVSCSSRSQGEYDFEANKSVRFDAWLVLLPCGFCIRFEKVAKSISLIAKQ